MKGSSMGGITIENGGLLRHDGASPNPRTHEAIATLLDPPFPHPRPQAVAQCGIKTQSDGSITQLQLMSTLFSGALRPRVFETARGAYLAFSTTCSDPAEVCFYPTDSIGMLGQDKKKARSVAKERLRERDLLSCFSGQKIPADDSRTRRHNRVRYRFALGAEAQYSRGWVCSPQAAVVVWQGERGRGPGANMCLSRTMDTRECSIMLRKWGLIR